ncbi:MAG: 50S ribosome-binding GTPase [Acidimicrobiia bacterium]|nr:50S ribosome-binding GTPase [Acidimicrobiia bacterium]
MTDETWQSDVLGTMERLIGVEATATVASEWDEHAARDKVEVTFLGPYSSGKSTLLRRLVVDGGERIPSWLTVSARRETFELNAVDVRALTFTDVPGFAAGSELHDELAQDALALSDAFLLVVPPQLLTSNRELVGSIVSGEYFFGEPRPGSERVVIAVIAQADSLGIDPDDDLDGMRQLAERKQSELISQLEDTVGASLPELQVFCVAADPYEEQARQLQPQRAAFDPYRDWDGIDALTDALDALPARRDELQRAAGLRYFCRVAGAVASQARAVVDELEASAEELRARQTEWTQQKALLDAVVEAARADLQTTFVALAGALSDELGDDQAESRSQIDSRMTAAIEHWAQRWDGEIDLVLGEANVRIDERLARPRAKRTEAFLRSLTVGQDTVEATATNSRIVNLLNDIKGEVDGIARDTFELWAGEPLDQLLDEARSAATATVAATRLAEATDAGTKALKMARFLDASLRIADGVMSIVTIVEAERRQQELDAQRRRQREAARDRIEADAAIASVEIVDGAGGEPGWRARADAAVEMLRERLGLTSHDNALDDLLQTVAAKQELVSHLEALITDAPRH